MTQNTTETLTNTRLTEKEAELTQALYNSWKTQNPLNEDEWSYYATDDETAYRVQDELTRLKNESVGGYKVSLTSQQTQDMFSSNEPLYGAQLTSHFLHAPTSVNLSDLMEPLVEVELCFRAKEELNANDTLEDLLNKTTVAPALEVPDSRFKDWFPSLSKYLVMSDAAVGGLVVYGDEFDTKLFQTVDALENVNCTLLHDGKELKSGKSTEVLGNPLKSLKWLVDKLATQHKTLRKNQQVSSGTFVLPPTLTKGVWQARFDNGLGNVDLDVK
ncbi:2-keto-4-pentenoate hydratase [Companilactobacillus jidongensis]|uniref:2-keto-4-pentenoate hydratase n=1 Tax=Companilactobacillus jidongensis TaxID=2486006 RepID=UPI000F79E0A5|nr:2-keto-4-pentenoate hydratase [Companilactobacillus jidongensis]